MDLQSWSLPLSHSDGFSVETRTVRRADKENGVFRTGNKNLIGKGDIKIVIFQNVFFEDVQK